MFDGPFGAVYSFYMAHEPVSRTIARLLWGGDIRPFYRGMRAIGETPPGGLIVDAPCGSGVALRALSPTANVRYLALDASARMLGRAREEARARGLEQVETVQGDVLAVPIADGSADLFLSHWGLHCFDDPGAALAEAARCLRPGGRLVGAGFVTGPSLRQRLLVRPDHAAFGRVVEAAELRTWLEAEFGVVELATSGPFAYFRAAR